MSSESRIWEIRLFGSMRGGRELVIGPWPFNPSSLAYSTTKLSPRFLSWIRTLGKHPDYFGRTGLSAGLEGRMRVAWEWLVGRNRSPKYMACR